MTERVRAYVAEHPGLRIEQINKELGTSTNDLKFPLKKLVAAGAVKTKGTRRSMTYFPGDASGKTAKKK